MKAAVRLEEQEGPATHGMPWLYRISWLFLRVFLPIAFGLRWEGVDRLPRGCLLAANHKSYLDPPVIGTCLPYAIRYLAKAELMTSRWSRAIMSRLCTIPVRRGRPGPGQMAACLRDLEAGHSLLVFPEGTRIRRDGFGEPRRGLGFFVRKSAAPVVPVYVGGTYRWWRALFRRRPVTVRFGAPMVFDEDAEDLAVAAQVLQAIAAMADPEDRGTA